MTLHGSLRVWHKGRLTLAWAGGLPGLRREGAERELWEGFPRLASSQILRGD